jgi:hypothetical protein
MAAVGDACGGSLPPLARLGMKLPVPNNSLCKIHAIALERHQDMKVLGKPLQPALSKRAEVMMLGVPVSIAPGVPQRLVPPQVRGPHCRCVPVWARQAERTGRESTCAFGFSFGISHDADI